MNVKTFELIITYEERQESFVIDDTPIMFGVSPSCNIVLGDGEPKIKCIIKLEGDHLIVKIYDAKFPIIIGAKKFKSAKIKNSTFFKIGPVDVVVDVLERDITSDMPLDLPDCLDLPDYDDVATDNVVENPKKTVEKTTEVLQASTVPEISLKEVAKLREDAIAKPFKDNCPIVMKKEIVEDSFNFNIVFDEENYEKIIFNSYTDEVWDFSSYIDLEDETLTHLPKAEIHVLNETQSIQVVHMNNGVVLNDKFFSLKEKRIFLSNSFNKKNSIQIHDCENEKTEFLFNRNDVVSVVAIEGYEFFRVVNDELVADDRKSGPLKKGERIILCKGTSQILVQYSDTPPSIKLNKYFDPEEDLLKSVSISWAFALLMIMMVMIFPPIKEDKQEKEMVVIYKRKKVNLEEKKLTPPTETVAKAQAVNDTKKPALAKQAPPPKAAKVAKAKPKKKKVFKKKLAKVSPKRRVTKKVSKAKPSKRKSKYRKVVKVAKAAPAPKKTYKFNFGSKMKSAISATSNTKLKTAQSSRSVNTASLASSSTVTTKYNSKSFGVTDSKIARFAAGGPSKNSKNNVGTKGLSGKTRATTAYLEKTTKILGAMDPNLIRKIMREYIPQFRHCYQRELVSQPKVAGVFNVNFQISPRGRGINIRVKSKGKGFSAKGRTCLSRVVKLIKFPKPKGGGLVDVKQPMNFSTLN